MNVKRIHLPTWFLPSWFPVLRAPHVGMQALRVLQHEAPDAVRDAAEEVPRGALLSAPAKWVPSLTGTLSSRGEHTNSELLNSNSS